jgi:hypothetical protein
VTARRASNQPNEIRPIGGRSLAKEKKGARSTGDLTRQTALKRPTQPQVVNLNGRCREFRKSLSGRLRSVMVSLFAIGFKPRLDRRT